MAPKKAPAKKATPKKPAAATKRTPSSARRPSFERLKKATGPLVSKEDVERDYRMMKRFGSTPQKPACKPAPASTKKSATKASASTPAGIIKKKTPSKIAAATKKPASKTTKPKAVTIASDTEKDITPDLRRLICSRGSDWEIAWVDRAAELYHRYRDVVSETCGFDHHQLMNACLDLAWKEADWSILPDRDGRYGNDGQESRTGRVDEGHAASEWRFRSIKMTAVIEPLMGELQTDRQRENMRVSMDTNPKGHAAAEATAKANAKGGLKGTKAPVKKAATKAKASVKETKAPAKKVAVKAKAKGSSEKKTPTKKVATKAKKASMKATPAKKAPKP